MAGRHHLLAGIISKSFYRRLCNLDITCNVMRHITQAFVANTIAEAEEYMSKVDTKAAIGAEPGQRKADLLARAPGVNLNLGHTEMLWDNITINPSEVSLPKGVPGLFGPDTSSLSTLAQLV